MARAHFVLSLFLYLLVRPFGLRVFRPRALRHFPLFAELDDSMDLTPDGKVRKRILRKGDASKGLPVRGDTLYIGWKIFNSAGSLVHSSARPSQAWLSDTQSEEEERLEEEPFDFVLGSEPSDVILGWEIGIASMFEGEISAFDLDNEYAFGAESMDSLGIGARQDIRTEVELYRIVASPFRTLKTVGPEESIKDELMEQIHRGESPISRDALERSPAGTVRAAPQSVSGEMVEELSYIDVSSADNKVVGSGTIPARPVSGNGGNSGSSSSSSNSSPASDTLSGKDEGANTSSNSNNAYVTGEGRDHSWTEDTRTIDIYLPLPGPVNKNQLIVTTEKNRLSVVVEMDNGSRLSLFDGPLRGAVRPSSTDWALLPPDPSATYKGERLLVSIEKAHGEGIWASVYHPDFLSFGLKMG